MTPLLAFYRGTGRDAAGRLLRDIREWDDDRLEYTHDYIQWLFPLREPSRFNEAAPALDDATVEAFRDEAPLRAELLASLERMLAFYGLELEQGTVRKSGQFAARWEEWGTPGNHNHLRITRILKSLALLGLRSEAEALFECLRQIYESTHGRITERTFQFWSDAARS